MLAGSLSTDTMARGQAADVVADVRQWADIGRNVPGSFLRPIGDLPHMPINDLRAC